MSGRPATDPSAAPTIGRGRYALVAKIAEGGMAGVYRAWDSELEVWRAVKVLLPEWAQRQGVRDRFEREASTMARLEHPHVIRVYDVVTDDALPYIVMELAGGGNLIRWLDAYGSMPPRLALQVTDQVARGLGAAHAVGVVHRDVKPHNVMITTDGMCKVTDFGIARVRLDPLDADMTRTGSTMGTIGYMSPEQRSNAKDVDLRADIYSLGALVYKLLTGSIVTDLFLVEHEPPLLDEVPQALRELIIRACYHDRERRFPNAAEFIATLSDLRPLLPADPPDTAPLPIPAPEQAVDPRSADPFPEIGPLLRPEPMSESPTTPSGRPRVLPYRMPAFEPKSSPGVPPSYAAVESEVPPPLVDDVSGSIHGKTRPLAPTERLGPEQGPRFDVHAFVEEHPWVGEALAIGPATRGLAALALLAWLTLCGLAVYGTVSVTSSGRVAAQARAHLYQTLDKEQSVFADFRRQGTPADTVRALQGQFHDFEQTHTEPDRWNKAQAYVLALVPHATSVSAEERVQRMHRAYTHADEAQRRWLATARSGAGRLAVGLGTARQP